MAKRLNLEPVIARVCGIVSAGVTTDVEDGVRWQANDQVAIKPSFFVPDNASNQTTIGRRKRFKRDLDAAMQKMGWTMVPSRTAWITFNKSGA